MNSFINQNQTPLTLEQIGQRAPSALATRPFDSMSPKYGFVPTVGVIQAMIAGGFQPFSAVQSRTRIAGARFRRPYITGIFVTDSRIVLAKTGETEAKCVLGGYSDLLRSWMYFISRAGLSPREFIEVQCLFAARVGFLGTTNA